MDLDLMLSTIVTLLVTVDPVGLAPIFLSLTHGMSGGERRGVALRATLIATGILIFFAIAGRQLLDWLEIGLPAFRIGGGLLLFWIAFEMVFERRTERKQETADAAIDEHARSIAAFPLAIPLMAGPGAITALILLSSRTDGNALALLALLLLLCFVMALCFLAFLVAGRIVGLLGRTGSLVMTRLLGILLTALAVQFVIDGIRPLMEGH
ncbi:MarC family protein [Roseomonas marmotae]|uniref:UPF0056 membrane protein n=1 Tax=Roseomonas marmotae TaxID=2768161 RepID=A0ABS3K7M9_9PROT|nr:MarC family protein [Roseomonas marmotae]QTI80851.1 MarC family protein [Roseomonas marmotae]